jgi:hypothetical protein
MHIEMFPEVFIELQREIQHHESLLISLLQLPKDSPMEMKLGEVAAYCDIVLDGDYTQKDVENLCKVLLKKLAQKRSSIIIVNGTVQ